MLNQYYSNVRASNSMRASGAVGTPFNGIPKPDHYAYGNDAPTMNGAEVHNLLRATGGRKSLPVGDINLGITRGDGTDPREAGSNVDYEGVRVPVLKNIAIQLPF